MNERDHQRYAELLTELRDVGRMLQRTRQNALRDALTHTQKKLITELRLIVVCPGSVSPAEEAK